MESVLDIVDDLFQPHSVLINFGVCACVLLICLLVLWLISLKVKDASIIDVFWGAGFAIVGGVCFLINPTSAYILLLCALPVIWGLRLTLYLAKRNLGHGEDYRYVAMNNRSGLSDLQWRKRAFFTIFLGQGVLILIISAPVWVGVGRAFQTLMYHPKSNPDELIVTTEFVQIGAFAVLGTIIWLIGFLFEAVGDAQLAAFKRKHADDAGPYEDKPVLDSGLWKYTRHPNYFGNSLIWWGIWLVACQAPLGWTTIFAPIIMTYLLVRVSGKDLLERKLKTRKAYADYIKRTPGFIPGRPKSP